MKKKLFVSLVMTLLLISSGGCGFTPVKKLDEAIPSSIPKTSDPQIKPSTLPISSSNPAPEKTPENMTSPEVLKQGSFKNGVHIVSGMVKIIKIENKNILRFENFNTENGPDLFVYLVKNSTGTPSENDFISLGNLKSTNGNFNYDIPVNLNINDYKTITIWCKSFNVNFGYATL